MTKQFCDICNKEIYGNNKFSLHIGHGAIQPVELDVCGACQSEILTQRKLSDIETYNKIKLGKKEKINE